MNLSPFKILKMTNYSLALSFIHLLAHLAFYSLIRSKKLTKR